MFEQGKQNSDFTRSIFHIYFTILLVSLLLHVCARLSAFAFSCPTNKSFMNAALKYNIQN